jgi:hypothetical protein
MANEALEFLKRASYGTHRIVSTGDLTELQIAEAASCGRMWVDEETHLGWVLLPWELRTQKDAMREEGFWQKRVQAGTSAAD